jgi:CHASE3 domain sensor protein
MANGWRQLKIQSKLLLVFGGIILVGVLITGWTVVTLTRLDDVAGQMVQTEGELSQALQVRNLLLELETSELSFVLTADEFFLHENERLGVDVDRYLDRALVRNEENEIKSVLYEMQRGKQAYDRNLQDVIEAGDAGEWEAARELGEASARTVDEMIVQVEKIIHDLKPAVDASLAASNRETRTSLIIGVSALVLFLLLAFAAGRITSSQVTSPLQNLIDAALALKDGQFDARSLEGLARRSDEIGKLAQSFISMAQQSDARLARLLLEADEIRTKLEQID